MNEIAVIIPAYNEELTIREVILSFHKKLPRAFFVVVDNNSKDKTNEIARETMSEIGCRGRVLFVRRQGKANAIRETLRRIDADVYVMVDADLTYSAEDAEKLLEPVLRDEADMVVGDRHSEGSYEKENKRRFHGFGNNLVKNLINLFFRVKLKDIMSGYRVFNSTFLRNYPILCEGFEIETEMTLHALDKKFRITEIPVSYKDRPEGSFSKLNTLTDGLKVIKSIFWIFKDYKPFLFFGFLSCLFLFAGLAVGIPPVVEFIRYRLIYKIPSAILATGLMILSFLSLTIGLILDTIVKLHKFDYELRISGQAPDGNKSASNADPRLQK